MTISIISTPITTEITLGVGNYSNNVTIAKAGTLTAPLSIAVYSGLDYPYGTLTNDGAIFSQGSADAVDFRWDGTLINDGTITGVAIEDFGRGTNFGTILAPGTSDVGLVLGFDGQFTNDGSILGAVELSQSTLNNASIVTGLVSGKSAFLLNQGSLGGGVSLQTYNIVINSGIIAGGVTLAGEVNNIGVYRNVMTNSGVIVGSTDGIYATGISTITDSGTISGGTDAILATGTLALYIEAGAVFDGAVVDSAGLGTIILGGTAAEGVSLASQFSGFDAFAFAAAGTLSGDTASLASGQIITGFGPGDTIILDGFAATSETFSQSTGLTLSNATASQTLVIAAPYNAVFTAITENGNTTLTVQDGPVSTITGTISNEVTVGTGYYPSSLTIASTGAVITASGMALYAEPEDTIIGDISYEHFPTLVNDGLIESGGTSQYNQYAAFIDVGSLTNTGTIIGVNAVDLTYTTANNSGLIASSAGAGVALNMFGGYFTNSGLVNGAINILGADLENTGQLSGAIYANSYANIVNKGSISGQVTLNGGNGGILTNTGTIIGGVLDTNPFTPYSSRESIVNDGLISGTGVGITFAGIGAITDAATIAGSTYAILATGALDLIIESGAVFDGKVEDTSSTGTIILGGSAPVGLSLSSQFIGFDSFSFASTTTGTLEGGIAVLAAGQTITGFGRGDTIILDGFAATSETFNQTTGLTLSNGSASQTLAIEGLLYDTSFTAITENGNTTLTAHAGGPVSTIAGTSSNPIELGSGNYLSNLTITSTGAVITANGPAISGNGNVVNDGLIEGSGGNGFEQFAVSLYSGTLTNGGTIIGPEVVFLEEATASNTGLIATTSSFGTALNMESGSFTNSGLISGEVSMSEASLDNIGTVNGPVDEEFASFIFNAGTINGLITLDEGAFTNTGTVTGGIVLDATLPPNFSYANDQIINDGVISGTGITINGYGGITDAGTIEGSTYAILATGDLALTIESGAVFDGRVEDTGTGTIILGGSTAVSLSLGSQFIGFYSFSFASSVSGTLEGGISALAGGETISGFTNGDAIILDGFAATSETFNQATGITLSNGTSTRTLGLQGLPYNAAFSITNSAGNTTLTVQDSPVSLVSGTITAPVTIGAGNYPASVTITSTGAALAGVTAPVAVLSPPTLVNHGLISGASNQYAVIFTADIGATLINTGTIIGHDGVKLVSETGSFSNSGLIASTGSAGTALYLWQANILNSGTIQGRTNVFGGAATNTGDINGPVYEQFGIVYNQGQITGAFDLHSGRLTNSGTLSGGINQTTLASEYIESPNVSISNSGLITGTSIGIALTGPVDTFPNTITYAGTIAGSTYAILAAGLLDLSVDAGGVFSGKVVDQAGTGTLILAGTTAGSLDLGTSFSGFPAISIANGAIWTLEGGASALASGQTISGFTNGDTIILDGFAATSETFSQASGLILSNGASTETLDLAGVPPSADFSLSTDNGNTTISASISTVSLISTTINGPVTIGMGFYAASVSITQTGLVQGSLYTSDPTGRATVTNSGTIARINGFAVDLEGFDIFTNNRAVYGNVSGGDGAIITNNGLISSFSTGIFIAGLATNNGTIAGSGTYLEGIRAVRESEVFNTGLISLTSTTSTGIYLSSSTLSNSGKILANIGVNAEFGSIANTGTIIGDSYGFSVFDSNIINSGKIYGGQEPAITTSTFGPDGIFIEGGLINNTGSIGGTSFGIYADGAASIITSGTISGGTDAIYATGSINLTIDPGAVFNGNVVDQSGAGTIVLAGTTGGTINISDPFTGFSNISFAAGSQWALTGSAAELADGETISGFTLGDHIELTDFAANSGTFVAGTGLVLSNGTSTETLNITGSFNSPAFAVSDGLVAALCFARGTKIHTPKGKRRIENLEIGEKILTRDGAEQEIKWIGRRSYDGRFIEDNHLALPVTIKAHALAKNVPSRDLTVSPGHGIFISGHLIPAWRLINGVTITQAAYVDQIDYFHIELGRHSVILAENCPAESFLDIGLRQQFHNADEYTGTPAIQAVALPRLEDGFLLQTIQRRLNLRAGILLCPEPTGALRGCIDEASPTAIRGWANCAAAPDMPISLDIFVDGAHHTTILANAYRPDLRAAGLGSGCHGFALPGVPGRIDIRRSLDATPLPHAPHACAA